MLCRCQDCELIFYDPPVCGDEAFYNSLQKYPWYYESDKAEFAWAAARIAPGSQVLEVGAGRGAFAGFIPACDYVGLDFSTGAQQLAAAQGVAIQLVAIEDWAASHPQTYDVVCHFQVLEHIATPDSFLKACVEALKPGGKLIVSVPSDDSFIGTGRDGVLNMPPHHVTRWSDAALRQLGDSLGCTMDCLEHELVADVHKPALAATILRQQWFGSTKPLDDRLVARVQNRLASLAAQLLRLDRADARLLGWGHTVNACYTKL